ncbi:MAG TPA: M48 family metalloprotease [Candidatus Sulfotelmatobacter sp.]
MRRSSVSRQTPQPERVFALLALACILPGLLAPKVAAKDSPGVSTQPAVEATTPEIGGKKLDKYDVTRIGQRDIGHGFNLYSLKREHELGQNLAASFDRMMKAVRDPVVNEYINRLAQKLIGNSDAVVPFTIKVVDSGEIPRAYGLPGGFLYVDSALIVSADDEAELATVMAHEIAHVAARHATRALSRKQMSRIVNSVAFMAGPIGAGVADAGGIAGPLSVKKFSRESEYEADLLGIEYAYAAGYDPQAMMDALEKLHAVEVRRSEELAKVPGYHTVSKIPFQKRIARSFADYPLTEDRIQRLEEEITTYLPNRGSYILDTDEFQEVKGRLLAARAPTLRHHPGDEENKGPVLRRAADADGLPDSAEGTQETQTSSRIASSRQRSVSNTLVTGASSRLR